MRTTSQNDFDEPVLQRISMSFAARTEKIHQARQRALKHRCDHGLALVIDPTENELRELEQMLADCPHCSRWIPGDGPIMAVVMSGGNAGNDESKTFVYG